LGTAFEVIVTVRTVFSATELEDNPNTVPVSAKPIDTSALSAEKFGTLARS
jgi:hypothetical protein